MIIYRPHRGTLADAMAEAKEFPSETEMKQFIAYLWDVPPENIVLRDPIDDNRNGWHDTRYVCICNYGTPQCVGMCATQY